jgi:hypothetical protein
LRYWFALICIIALVGAATAGQFNATLDVDAYVDKNKADESFSDGNTLWTTSSDGISEKEAYLGFINTLGSEGIFTPEALKSASLKVYVSEVEKPGKVDAYLLHGATLDTLTWNDTETYYQNTRASVDISKAGEYTIDVTPLIRKAVEVCTEGCPYTIVLVAEDSASVGFGSSESNEAATLTYRTED